MQQTSFLELGEYSCDWVRDFYVQSDIWWGADAGADSYPSRMAAIERLSGTGPKRILELGAGSGSLAAMLAQAGHQVVAVELTDSIRLAQHQPRDGWPGSLTALEADFYTVTLDGQFQVICYWDGFGLGSDADQRLLLRRIAQEWLLPGGSVLMDVFSPVRLARHAGEEVVLPPLKGVPGSVEMRRRCHFDPVQCRWIDEWEPTAAPENALAQTLRCYSPADLQLLLEGTGLRLLRVEVNGQAIDISGKRVAMSSPLLDTYSYLAQLVMAR